MGELDEYLAHFGVKGMKWGQRRSREPEAVRVTQKPGSKKLKASGGGNRQAHIDAVNAAAGKQVIRKSGTNALSNKELKDLVERMNLESQYVRLSSPQKKGGADFVNTLKEGGKFARTMQDVAKDSPNMASRVAEALAMVKQMQK